jgi:DNA sulfur modification protein DndE
MAIESVRINEDGKIRLSTLTRETGIVHRNILCRWALCVSLADPSAPQKMDDKGETAHIIEWNIFGGEFEEIYLGILKMRCKADGLEINDETLAEQLWCHIHRGLDRLSHQNSSVRGPRLAGRRSVQGLLELAINLDDKETTNQILH